MKAKSRVFSVTLLLLAMSMVSTVMISGTFAKYTTAVAGQDTALVARWSFNAQGGQDSSLSNFAAASAPAELDLFSHASYTNMNNDDGAGESILAPGVDGDFVVKVSYIADVAADIKIETVALADNAAVPIEYSVDSGVTWVDLDGLSKALADKIIADTATTGATASVPATVGVFRLAATATGSTTIKDIEKTVQWRWAYVSADDTVDTALGEDSQTAAKSDITKRTTYGIKITLTATQVTPTVTP